MLNTCLDIFEIRQNNKTIEQDLGLLQAVDERLATYGWLTNTGIKFVIVVDMAGRPPAPDDDDRRKAAVVLGLRDSDLKPVWQIYTHHLNICQLTPDSGIPCFADCIHTAASKPFLFAR